jgi:hypothetical protein
MIRARRREGRCYELSARIILARADVVLVHGRARGPDGSPIDHAWIEGDGFVHDATKDKNMAPEMFYRMLCAVPLVRYTPKQAADMILLYGHFGPWHTEPIIGGQEVDTAQQRTNRR